VIGRALPHADAVPQDVGMADKRGWGYGYGIGGTAFLVVVVILAAWLIL